MNEKKDILLPEPTLRRLPWYLAYVNMLQSQGIEYVSSTQISKEIKQGVDYIVPYRQDDTSTPAPSSIIKLNENGTIQIIRK